MPMNTPLIRPKKSLGQNFLRDKNIARKMVEIFSPGKSDIVVEIGPGTGILSELIAGTCERLILVEKDYRAVDILQQHFEGDEHITIIQGDILEMELQGLTADKRKVRVIGNIPYNITSPILFHILDQWKYVSDVMLLVQYEVAHRIMARPSTAEYGILSVLSQTWSTPSFLFKVPPTVFYPRPAVDSAVIRLVFDRRRDDIADEELYRAVVRGTFGQRRKMLRSSLKNMFPGIPFHTGIIHFDVNKRPEECGVDDFIHLTREIYAVNRNE
jgi:16S rRNA (adenine1518-N6/adenine1519-N6)-dimethyltransferase